MAPTWVSSRVANLSPEGAAQGRIGGVPWTPFQLTTVTCSYIGVDMKTARLFRHGGSQAVRLPREFRFEGGEVLLEKRGEEVVLRPMRGRRLRSLRDVAKYMAKLGADFPGRDQPRSEQQRDLTW